MKSRELTDKLTLEETKRHLTDLRDSAKANLDPVHDLDQEERNYYAGMTIAYNNALEYVKTLLKQEKED